MVLMRNKDVVSSMNVVTITFWFRVNCGVCKYAKKKIDLIIYGAKVHLSFYYFQKKIQGWTGMVKE